MKSPWKFLVDLASRGRAVEQPERMPEAAPERPTEPPMPMEDPIAASTSDGTAAIVETALVAVETDPVAGETVSLAVEIRDDQAIASVASEPARATEAVVPPRRKLSRRHKPSKSKAQNVASADGVAYEVGNSKPRVPIAFADEVTALDEDIRQLRRQLGQKLALQNAQLKKMLERF
ncbi:hypothetical protein IB267_16330 [Ensifer sp. ENS09]|uniref:hypothetical protein n=1 Tax=Ensifer sp. ENS09 TaxID=2769263 RepID=UPI001780BF17|nr:hypothetical protein [Ensifer sp. ENS09]MBD9649925.1 hypothetical protein [Ensifer sp. ENS09]